LIEFCAERLDLRIEFIAAAIVDMNAPQRCRNGGQQTNDDDDQLRVHSMFFGKVSVPYG
jgi:hypothetical protein